MGQIDIKTPDGKTLNVPFSGTPPSDADVQAIIADYERSKAPTPKAAPAYSGPGVAPVPGAPRDPYGDPADRTAPVRTAPVRTAPAPARVSPAPPAPARVSPAPPAPAPYDPAQHSTLANLGHSLTPAAIGQALRGTAAAAGQAVVAEGKGLGNLAAKTGDAVMAGVTHLTGNKQAHDNYIAGANAHDQAEAAAADQVLAIPRSMTGTLQDVAQAAGSAKGGQPGLAKQQLAAIPKKTAQAFHDDPVQTAINVASIALPALHVGAVGLAASAGKAVKIGAAMDAAAAERAVTGDAAGAASAARVAQAAKRYAGVASVASKVAHSAARGGPIGTALDKAGTTVASKLPPALATRLANAHAAMQQAAGDHAATAAPPPADAMASAGGKATTVEHSATPAVQPRNVQPNVPTKSQNIDTSPAPVEPADVSANDTKPAESIATPAEAKPGITSRLVPDFPVDQLHVDPERFQYKMNPGQGGQTGSLSGARAYNPDLAGVVHAWKDPADGRNYVVNGHNRYGLAQRTGQPTMDVRFLDAPDAATARSRGALINIAEGQGTPLDAAKLFRDAKTTPEDLAAQGISLKGANAKQGLALANLSPSLFGQVARGEMPVERAALIGDRLPAHADQHALVSLIDRAQKRGKAITNDVVSELADQAGAAPSHTETTSTLFGDEETTQNLALQRAEVAAYVKTQLGKEGAVFGQASKNADRLAKGNNVIDAETSARIATASRQGGEVFDRTKNAPGPVADILNTAAQRLAKGEKPDVVKSDALRQFQAHVAENQSAPESPGVADAQSPGPAGQAGLGFGEDGDAAPGPGDPAQSPRGGGAAGADGGAVHPQRVAAPAGAHGSPIQELDSPARPNPTPAMTRIAPEPITGGTPKRLSQIIGDFGKNMERQIRVTKHGRGVAGTYTPGSAKTAIRFAGDLDTTAHEIGHALDDRFGLVSPWKNARQKSPFDAELKPFWEAGGSQTKSGPRSRLAYKRAEGVAEFVRAYIVNPKAAEAAAPTFHSHFTKTIPADVLSHVHTFSRELREFAGLSATEKIGANIHMDATRPTMTELLTKHLKGEGLDFETTGLDRTQALLQDSLKPFTKAVEAARRVGGKTSLLPADDPIVLARTHAGVGGKMLNILDKGMIDAQGKRVTPGGIDWLLEPFDKSTHENLAADMEDTVRFMAAQRTLEKATQTGRQRVTGIGGGLYDDPGVARQALKEFDADPARLARLEEGADRYRQWADSLLQYQVQKGRMSRAAYEAVKADNDFYVALQREMDTINPPRSGSGNAGSRLGSAKQTVHAFKGSTREIHNPYRTLMDQTQAMVKETDRNEVLKAFRDMLTVQRGMYQGDVKNFDAIGSCGALGDKNTVRIFVDGKAEYWKFEPGVYETLKGFGEETRIPKLMTLPASLMRGAVTHAPGFLVRNVFRDAVDRTLLSKHGGKPWDIVGKTSQADRDAFDLAGGGQAGHYLVSKEGYGKAIESAMRRLSDDPKTILSLPGDYLEKYQHLAHSSEMVGRYAEYKKAFAHAKTALGYDDYNAGLYAASEARGLMDFAVAGSLGRQINSVFPFTNAALQGTTNLLRAARAPGAKILGVNAKFLGRWATYVVIPEVANYVWNVSQGKDARDEFRQLPAYQRDMFYNFRLGPDLWLRIPKGFEAATLASGVSRSIDRAAGNKNAFEGYTGDVAKSFIPISPDILASGLAPSMAEDLTNYDVYRATNIVPPYENNLRLDLRKGAGKASRLGQAMTKVLGTDPRKNDHFIRSQFGDLGVTAARVSDLGRSDKSSGRDLLMSLPGVFTGSPAANAPDVQQVMTLSQALGKPNPLKDQMGAYYDAKTPAQRDVAARTLREAAHGLRPDLEAENRKPAGLIGLLSAGHRRGGPHRPSRPHR